MQTYQAEVLCATLLSQYNSLQGVEQLKHREKPKKTNRTNAPRVLETGRLGLRTLRELVLFAFLIQFQHVALSGLFLLAVLREYISKKEYKQKSSVELLVDFLTDFIHF